MTRWEYRLLDLGMVKGVRDDALRALWQERINDLGRDGWEAVSGSAPDVLHFVVLLKREMPDAAESGAPGPGYWWDGNAWQPPAT